MRKPADFAGHPISYIKARAAGHLRGVCKYVVDGDTIDVFLDLGMLKYAYETIRLARFDAPEIVGANRARGLACKARAQELLLDKPVLIQTWKDTVTFNRFVADVWFMHETSSPDGVVEWRNFSDTMIVEGWEVV